MVPELETLSVLRLFVSLAVVCCPMRRDPSLVTSSNTPERHTHTHTLPKHFHWCIALFFSRQLALCFFLLCSFDDLDGTQFLFNCPVKPVRMLKQPLSFQYPSVCLLVSLRENVEEWLS